MRLAWGCVAIFEFSVPGCQSEPAGGSISQRRKYWRQNLLAAASLFTAFGRSGDYLNFTQLLVLSLPYWSMYALKETTLVAVSSCELQANPMSRKSQQPEACVRAAGLLGL